MNEYKGSNLGIDNVTSIHLVCCQEAIPFCFEKRERKTKQLGAKKHQLFLRTC